MSTFTPSGGSAVTIKTLADTDAMRVAPEVSVRHIPGGPYTYIDLPGAALPTLDLTILFDNPTTANADMAAFLALAGQQGVLVWTEGTQGVVFLGAERSSRAVHSQGPHTVTAHFLLLG